ncbi:adaptor protein MecA [Eubacterium sp. MSJ-21]|nr:adaptor protein MecA [Eubacterium sp. MSJ-21]
MKLERLSENQIRCTLYKSDLADKELHLTELAYGTEKAKELFRELMQQASSELGFEVDNVPLMIEAIPVSPECLILVITKVEDPEELDTRFSRFTRPSDVEDVYDEDEDDDENDGGLGLIDESEDESMAENNPVNGLLKAIGGLAEDLSGLMSGKGVKSVQSGSDASDRRTEIQQPVEQPEIFRIYAFKNLDQVILSAKLVRDIYDSENSLYKNPRDSHFYLYMTKDKNTDNEFVKTCNLLGEYSSRVRATYATPSHMREHYKLIIDANALQTLAKL